MRQHAGAMKDAHNISQTVGWYVDKNVNKKSQKTLAKPQGGAFALGLSSGQALVERRGREWGEIVLKKIFLFLKKRG